MQIHYSESDAEEITFQNTRYSLIVDIPEGNLVTHREIAEFISSYFEGLK